MKYTNEQLDYAQKKGVFTEEQILQFKSLIQTDFHYVSKFQQVLYYGGGLLVISALTWLLKSSWDEFGPIGMVIISLLYLVLFSFLGYYVFYNKKMILPGGLLFCVAISVMPLLVFSLLRLYNFWPASYHYDDFYIWIKGKWIVLELTTIIFALVIFAKTKFPFIILMISFALWFLSMDIVPIIFSENTITWTNRSDISQVFGVLMLLCAYFIDLKSKREYSFWLYLFGLITLTSGLSVFYNDDTLSLIILLLVHLLMIILSLFLEQTVFMVFGMIGLTEFLSRISYVWFEDSPVFPFLLTIIGLALIFSGMFYQKNQVKISNALQRIIPRSLQNLRPKRLN